MALRRRHLEFRPPQRKRNSAWNLLSAARHGHADWAPAWREDEPKPRYDVLIIGGGGHGLATAYYLARNHGITNVAVLEAGWIGGGNTGRNTTIVRSNYLYPESARLYDFALRQYEQLAQQLNFNIMLSQRGIVTLAPLGTDWNMPFLEEAPVLIAIFAQRYGVRPDGEKFSHYYVPEAVGIASGSLIAALHHAGLATLTHTPNPMSFLNTLCGRPSAEKPVILLVVDYPKPGCQVPVHGGIKKPLTVISQWP